MEALFCGIGHFFKERQEKMKGKGRQAEQGAGQIGQAVAQKKGQGAEKEKIDHRAGQHGQHPVVGDDLQDALEFVAGSLLQALAHDPHAEEEQTQTTQERKYVHHAHDRFPPYCDYARISSHTTAL